jgi:stearoyl-CoA desaturase (delta-9 desaturase)
MGVIAAVVGWFLAFGLLGLGNTAGYHRLLTHRAYKAHPAVFGALSVLGALHSGPPLLWVGLHRHHHLRSDTPDDPHSPTNGGLLQAHSGWLLARALGRPVGALAAALFALSGFGQQAVTLLHDLRRLRGTNPPVWLEMCKDLQGQRILAFLERPLVTPALFGLQLGLAWGIGGGAGLLWLWALHLGLTNSSWAVNSICHGAAFGRAPHDTGEGSRDVPWLAPFTLGEAYHNTHHRYPRSARHGLEGFDPSWTVITVLVRLGLASEPWLPRAARGGCRPAVK